MLFSIFIASITSKQSPRFTWLPTLTLIADMVPGSGALIAFVLLEVVVCAELLYVVDVGIAAGLRVTAGATVFLLS